MLRNDKYCPEKGSRGVMRPKICQNVSKIPLFLVSKTGPPKRIFLIINRYDNCNEYSIVEDVGRVVRGNESMLKPGNMGLSLVRGNESMLKPGNESSCSRGNMGLLSL